MISTTLASRNPALELASHTSSKTRAHVRENKAARNWTLLLVFLVSPLVMLCLAAWTLMVALG